jgi:hypothetical protein
MSPEQNNLNATWQNPNALDWDDVSDEATSQRYDQDEEEAMFDTPAVSQDDVSDEEGDVEAVPVPRRSFFSRFEFLAQLGQQLSPILAPLLFGGITFLIILPLILSGHAYTNVGRLGAIGLGFFAIAVLQCMMLYYAGSNNVYWTLSIIGGFFLFLLVGCFAVFGPIPTLVFFVVLVVLSLVMARFYMRPVAEGSVAIVYAFGKYRRTLFPGLNFLLPWEWIDEDARPHTRERQWTSPEQTVAISREEDVHLKAMISYQLVPEDAYLAMTQIENWEESLHHLFEVMLQTASNRLTPNDFITWQQSMRSLHGTIPPHPDDMLDESRWERVNTLLFQQMRDHVASWGVLINWVHIRDITVTPRSVFQDSGKLASMSSTTGTANTASTRPPIVPNMGAAEPPQQPPQQQPIKIASNTNPSSGTSTTLKIPNPMAPLSPMAPQPPPAASTAVPSGKLPKEDSLIKAYKQIQDGRITSPETIRRIASDFQRIASSPEASRTASFDAGRAAEVLFERANMYEEQANAEMAFTASSGFHYDQIDQFEEGTPGAPVSSGWKSRPPNDDNLMAGG